MPSAERPGPSRRELFAAAAAVGIGTPTFHRAVAAEVAADPVDKVTPEMVRAAEWVAGVELTDDQRKQVAAEMTQAVRNRAALHKVELPNSVPPAIHFRVDADPPPPPGRPIGNPWWSPPYVGPAAARPEKDEDLAFLPLTHLAALLGAKKVTSTELTKLYRARLGEYDPALKCVVTLTEDLALKQAEEADQEIAAGKYRGPLHGIPWGAKDLIGYPGYKTTWGAGQYKEQTLDTKATVAERLDAAGAVLVAKTTLGALAMGDQWFGGMTRNPWNVKQGSSGSSAGSASAVAAGLVGFAIGSETYGSIVSPCTRCGVTGLRPTFGRVSRAGCMALSWSMDKIGPIARSVEDCALVFRAIHGADGRDPTAATRPFPWPYPGSVPGLRVGYVEGPKDDDRAELQTLKDLGFKLVPIKLPKTPPADPLLMILMAEAAAAFDGLARAGVTDGIGAWGRTFRAYRFVSAVDYLRAQRVRTLLMREMAKVMEDVDVYVGGNDLLVTNLTGHPSVVLPNGLRKGRNDTETPTAITFTGRLWGEGELLAVAKAYQEKTGHHLKRPDMAKVTKELADGKE
ncbi:MAG: amidase [Gemmataceae bacterium]|nr:amidase [Gemmataceae bacterium]